MFCLCSFTYAEGKLNIIFVADHATYMKTITEIGMGNLVKRPQKTDARLNGYQSPLPRQFHLSSLPNQITAVPSWHNG